MRRSGEGTLTVTQREQTWTFKDYAEKAISMIAAIDQAREKPTRRGADVIDPRRDADAQAVVRH